MKEMKAIEAIKDLIQILRFLIFQLHLCDINGPIIKIICFREIYLSLTKKIVYRKKNLFLLPSGQAEKNFIDKISTLMASGYTSRH